MKWSSYGLLTRPQRCLSYLARGCLIGDDVACNSWNRTARNRGIVLYPSGRLLHLSTFIYLVGVNSSGIEHHPLFLCHPKTEARALSGSFHPAVNNWICFHISAYGKSGCCESAGCSGSLCTGGWLFVARGSKIHGSRWCKTCS